MKMLRQIRTLLLLLIAGFVATWLYFMPTAEVRGVWRVESGGMILQVSRFSVSLYSETAVSCDRYIAFPAHLKIVELAEGAVIDRAGDQLRLSLDGNLGALHFNRIEALPDTCGKPDPGGATPQDVFDAFWHGMEENYAFFDLYGVDWQSRRALAPAQNAEMTDEDLLALLSEALDGLNDGHLQVESPLGVVSPRLRPEWTYASDRFSRAYLNQVARDAIGIPLIGVENTGIEYALLPDGVGYVLIRHMQIRNPLGTQEGPAMAQAFDEVARALQSANAIVLDLRYNPGGSDTVSFGVAGHFTAVPVPVFSKTTRFGDETTEPFYASVRPFDDTPLDQPVIVLTTGLTASAAEIFTMALQEMPNVTTMGTPTSGALSDIFDLRLPNGWTLGLSNQIYTAANGVVYEGTGIPPKVPFPVQTERYIEGADPTLEAALARARGQ